MAGVYPDNPSRRMAWDADGTIMVVRNVEDSGEPAEEVIASRKTDWATEDMTTDYYYTLLGGFLTSGSDIGWFSWIFPELREVDGFFASGRLTSPFDQISQVMTSGDTKNTVDGTWTQRIANYVEPDPVNVDSYREDIDSLAVSNVRGVRMSIAWGGQSRTGPMHLYGEISAGETPDRLLWFDDDDDLEIIGDDDGDEEPEPPRRRKAQSSSSKKTGTKSGGQKRKSSSSGKKSGSSTAKKTGQSRSSGSGGTRKASSAETSTGKSKGTAGKKSQSSGKAKSGKAKSGKARL